MVDVDPFDGEPTESANPIRTDRSKAGTSSFSLKVDDVSDVREGDYGSYVLVSGEVTRQVDTVGGNSEDPGDSPVVGDYASYLVSWSEDTTAARHVQEEIQKAVKRAGGPLRGFVKPGDLLHVKLLELQAATKAGKKYPKGKEFGRHAFKVERHIVDPFAATEGQSDDLPF